MKIIHFVCLISILTLSACELPEQRGLFGMDSVEQAAKDEAASQSDDALEVEEEFEPKRQYTDEDLEAVAEFVTIRAAIGAVEKSIKEQNRSRQGIKTGFLYGGIALMTSTNSAYWFKDGTLYSANPFARAYSPELPKAPSEINEKNVLEATQLSTDAAAGRNVGGSIEQHFGEFVGLVDYINAAVKEKDESAKAYTMDFLDGLTMPVSEEQDVSTIEQFRRLFNTIETEQQETYEELNVAQSLTIYTFGRATEGMNHDQVARILGNSDDPLVQDDKESDMITMYAWRESGVSNLYVFFRNDELSDKVILGYN